MGDRVLRRNRQPAGQIIAKLNRRGPPPAPRADHDGQEEAVARAVPAGKRTPGSGCSRRPSRKGDVVGDLFRVEAKTTSAGRTMSIERGWLERITAQALPAHRPALTFGFDADTTRLCTENPADYLNGVREDWIAFRLSDGQAMMHAVAALVAGDVETARRYAEMLKP